MHEDEARLHDDQAGSHDEELSPGPGEELPMAASRACSLDAGEAERRLGRWRRVLEGSLIGTGAPESAVRLILRDDAATRAELDELVELERECCPFADWTLSERKGALQLDVAAGPEHADVLEEIRVIAEEAR